MAMGTRKKRQRQEELWYGGELPTAPGHPFYKRLNEVLESAQFDSFCETNCATFYHKKLGRPSLLPGQYFRVMMIGFSRSIQDNEQVATTATALRSQVRAGTVRFCGRLIQRSKHLLPCRRSAVLHQDTGFGALLPTDEGVLKCSEVEVVLDGLGASRRTSGAMRWIAEESFEAATAIAPYAR